ncbi:F1F0 ATP synthase assembly protein Atp10 [Ephemerocybe angulata]|uniref:F1F0 ATP synthase assembly protein Atp10 n=1 Tax=Ephemerocybe angulata TaxID=980116 RepID=A0A8H6MGV1_9AGAR|nr:F1F0 ATP synthase assembly protein Atp10 [Tulosesus angulatus]
MLRTRNIVEICRNSVPVRRNLHWSAPVCGEQAKPNAKAPTTMPARSSDPPPNDVELGPLSRPLGVRERPTTVIKTAGQKMRELLDSDVRTAQRRHLIKEATKGYFHDMNMTRRHGGKTWIAPNVLIRDDKALYLPNISGKSLLDKETKNTTEMCFGKVTVLSMLSTKISEIHSQALIEPTYAQFSSDPKFQYVQVNLQENVLKAFLVNLIWASFGQRSQEELQKTYILSSQNVEYIREAIGMTNSKVGYVYLIDENLRIRWAACAEPLPEEVQALESCTGVLLKRIERKGGAKGKPARDSPKPSPLDARS